MAIMQNITELISQNRLGEALTILHNQAQGTRHENTILLLRSRLSAVKKAEISNTQSGEQLSIRYSRITHAVLSLCEQMGIKSKQSVELEQPQIKTVMNYQNVMESVNDFIKKNIVSNPDFATKAKEVRNKLRDYEDDKLEYLGNNFDADKSKWKSIVEEWEGIQKELSENAHRSVENQVIQVRELLIKKDDRSIQRACRIMSQLNPGISKWKDMYETMDQEPADFIKTGIVSTIESEISRY